MKNLKGLILNFNFKKSKILCYLKYCYSKWDWKEMVRGKEPREMGVGVVVAGKVSFYFYTQTKTYTKYDQTGLNNRRIKKK